MNVASARVALRERDLVDVVDLAIRFMAVHRRVFARASLFTVVGPALLVLALGLSVGPYLASAIALALPWFVSGPFTLLASRLVFEEAPSLRVVFKSAIRAAWRHGVGRVLQAVAVACGCLSCAIPGMVVWSFLLFVPEAILLEDAKLWAAFARSSHLARTRSAESIAAAFFFPIMQGSVVVLGYAVGRVFVGEWLDIRSAKTVAAAGPAFALAAYVLFIPFSTTMRFFLYIDLRTRAEGWDVQTRFAALARRRTGDAGPR